MKKNGRDIGQGEVTQPEFYHRRTIAQLAGEFDVQEYAPRNRQPVEVDGVVENVRIRQLKSGRGYLAFFHLSDDGRSIEAMAFSKVTATFAEPPTSGMHVVCRGQLHFEMDGEDGGTRNVFVLDALERSDGRA